MFPQFNGKSNKLWPFKPMIKPFYSYMLQRKVYKPLQIKHMDQTQKSNGRGDF